MAYENIIQGGVIVEIPKAEYEKLISLSERISAADRYVKANTYPNVEDMLAILGIEKREERKAE